MRRPAEAVQTLPPIDRAKEVTIERGLQRTLPFQCGASLMMSIPEYSVAIRRHSSMFLFEIFPSLPTMAAIAITAGVLLLVRVVPVEDAL